MAESELGSLWMNDLLLNALLKNGYAKTNGNKSWELTDLQFLFLTPDLAKGFLKFIANPLYHKQFFEVECSLIQQNAAEIAEAIGTEPFNLIDIWCGDGLKAIELIKAFNSQNKKNVNIRYCPLGASQYLLDLAIANVKKANISNVVAYQPFLSSGDGHSLRSIGGKLRDGDFEKHVVMLAGGVLMNYEINSYLFELSRDLRKGDFVFIGDGVRVGERLVEIDKYKQPIFHEWFKHLIYGLELKDSDVEYDARFGNARIEMFYRFKVEKIKKSGSNVVKFIPGDELVVAVMYKYYAHEFDKFCKMYFTDTHIVTDVSGGYAIVMCRK